MLYSTLLKWIFLLAFITMVIFSLACFFLKNEPTREMKSKFESGIDQNEQESSPFYMHFFYIGMLFLVFDVEVILSIPMIQSSMSDEMWTGFWTIFISIIFLGLLVEMNIDSIEWKE